MIKNIVLSVGLISNFCFSQEAIQFSTTPKENTTYIVEKIQKIDNQIDILDGDKIHENNISSESIFNYEIRLENMINGKIPHNKTYTSFVYKRNKNGKEEVVDFPLTERDNSRGFIDNSFMEIGFYNLKFPEYPIKIGDSFSYQSNSKSPFNKEFQVDSISNYTFTLKDIKENIAFFEVQHKIDFIDNPNISFKEIEQKNAYLQYDFINNLITQYKEEVSMDFILKQDLVMESKVNSITTYKATIKK